MQTIINKQNKIGIAADHGGFEIKLHLIKQLYAHGYDVEDFGAHHFMIGDDYPDFIVPMAKAIMMNKISRGLAISGSGVGASITANKVYGVRAALINDSFSAHQGEEDDNMNVICLGSHVTGYTVAWDLVQTFLNAQFKGEEGAMRRIDKIMLLENDNNIEYLNHVGMLKDKPCYEVKL